MTKKSKDTLIFETMKNSRTEELIFKYDKETNLKFILIKHSTLLNKKVNGGIRMAGYETLPEALEDGIKLAEAMTLKNILYGLPWGGGKAVILGKPQKNKKNLHKIGDFVESFNGYFQTTIDMGFTEKDAEVISERTQFIDSLDPKFKKGCLGPSATGTGIGVVEGMRVAMEKVFGTLDFKGKTIAIQGLGRVGGIVANTLLKEGANIIGADKDENIMREFKQKGVKVVSPEKIYEQECDLFSPCANGGILNSKTIKKLKCKIIAGGANNQLENQKIGELLAKKGILYIPDFVINGGGMIQSQCEYDKKTIQLAHDEVKKRVSNMVRFILEEADKNKELPFKTAHKIVDEKLKRLREKY